MPNDYEPISKYELLQGLGELEKAGELTKPKEEVLHEVIMNTQRAYSAHGKDVQPFNAKHAKQRAKHGSPEVACSKKLRQNMIAAGRPLPKNTAAHHIVPGKDGRAWVKDNTMAARAILNRWGISINHEANGVALPCNSKSKVCELPNALPHSKTHTKVYYLNLAGQLGASRSQADCLDILREIGEDLEDGKFPV